MALNPNWKPRFPGEQPPRDYFNIPGSPGDDGVRPPAPGEGPRMIGGVAYGPGAGPMIGAGGVAYGAGSPPPITVSSGVRGKDKWQEEAWKRTKNKTNELAVGNSKMGDKLQVSTS